ncbi:MAG TPA: DinB family protein [Acidimicrobiia bacterium]|nr:DinB family protein [Acidimicrobiia bacterium]
MLTNDELVRDFERNRRIIHSQCEGLTNEDSLLQPPFAANCLNWTVGHIVVHRDKVLAALGGTGVLDEATLARYNNESDPVTGDGPDVRSLADLLTALDESQQRLAQVAPTADMEAAFDHERFKTVGARVRFYYFHDTYHTGQTELLRALAGRTEKVI